jgi:predicted ATP-dependent endonuclease of OLD family
MFIKQLSILGFRGFSKKQNLDLAIPNGHSGSGLTVLVGPNNSGKSSIIESFKYLTIRGDGPSFTESKRNKKAGDKVYIDITSESGMTLSLQTQPGSSESFYDESQIKKNDFEIFVVPSRRTFNPFFYKGTLDRKSVIGSEVQNTRGTPYSSFEKRIFEIRKNPKEYNLVLSKVFDKVPIWTIDQTDTGQYFIKFNFDGSFHNSDGAGEGLLSVFIIVEALFDSKPGEIIVIDEPELSLHPSLQKKVIELLIEYAKDRQIVLSTHSPYFISWESLINDGKLARIIKEKDGITIYPIDSDAPNIIKSLTANLNNPHILGLDAKEIFFLDDDINIVEGQEDVIFYEKILTFLEVTLTGTFYGWGIGGTGNLGNILKILQSLGFKKVNIILDNDALTIMKKLSKEYHQYHFVLIPTNDVRDKEERVIKSKEGLIDSAGKEVKPQYTDQLKQIFYDINKYFRS